MPNRLEVPKFYVTRRAPQMSFGKAFAEHAVDDLIAPAARAIGEAEEVERSRDLTPEGKRRAIVRFFDVADSHVVAAAKKHNSSTEAAIATEAKSVEKLFAPPSDVTERLIYDGRIARVLPLLREEDALARRVRMAEALENFDSEPTRLLLASFEDGLRSGFPIIDADEFKSFYESLVRRANPKIGDLIELRDAYADVANQVRQELRVVAEELGVRMTPESERTAATA
jgi:hypothetical protein